jgi:RNA-directed DNA polymerase
MKPVKTPTDIDDGAHESSNLGDETSRQWHLPAGDIKGCFDNFGHGWLESHIPMDKKVLSGWLNAGYVESGKLFPTEAGTPQEGIASPTIANIALDGLESMLSERFGHSSTHSSRAGHVGAATMRQGPRP